MLTLDDLEHFSDQSMAHLFTSATNRQDADKVARLGRILACLTACRDIPTESLGDGAIAKAGFQLRTALRGQRRNPRIDPAILAAALESALAVLGQPETAAECASGERLEMEAEIQTAAGRWTFEDTLDPELMGALARGEFEILPSSNLLALAGVVGKLGGGAQVDLDLAIDGAGLPSLARVHLVLEGGLWRWSAQEGCCMSRDGHPAIFLPPDDAVVQALLAGVALNGGRIALAWAETLAERDEA